DYYLAKPASELRIQILDSGGQPIRTIAGTQAPNGAGLHRIAWDLRASAITGGGGGRGGRGGEGGGRAGAGGRGPQVLPGNYTVRLTSDGMTEEQKVVVRLDPEVKTSQADLLAQWDALSKLGIMMREVATMIQQADQHADSPEWQSLRD